MRVGRRRRRSTRPMSTSTRTCIGCRQTDDPEKLVRVVLEPNGRIKIDRRRSMPGRGAWLHPSRDCVEEAVKRDAMARTFKRKTQPIQVDALWLALAGRAV